MGFGPALIPDPSLHSWAAGSSLCLLLSAWTWTTSRSIGAAAAPILSLDTAQAEPFWLFQHKFGLHCHLSLSFKDSLYDITNQKVLELH